MVEVGSGLGYWAHLLKMRSGDDTRVRCFDPYAPTELITNLEMGVEPSESNGDELVLSESAGADNEDGEAEAWFGEERGPFTRTVRGSFEWIADDPGGFQNWSLFVCWPSDGQWPKACLQAFRGDDFFYVGEGEGGATRMPWKMLREEWQLERMVEIPRWPGFKDALWWYRRRGATPLPYRQDTLPPAPM